MFSVENSESESRHHEGDEDTHGGNAEHQDRACGTVLGQFDRRMRRRMEQVERGFECAIEQLRGQHHAAIDKQ